MSARDASVLLRRNDGETTFSHSLYLASLKSLVSRRTFSPRDKDGGAVRGVAYAPSPPL